MNTQIFLIALLVAVSAGEEKKTCFCTFDYTPLCASDGVVYSNKCLFECAKTDNPTLSVLTEGVCPEDADNAIESEEMTVFANSDNDSPEEMSDIANSAGFSESESEEVAETKDACMCTMELRPLCGSDSVVYGNPCLFDCARKNNPSLTVLHTGNCDSEHNLPQLAIDPPVEHPCICTREFRPVCGITSEKEITYANQCEFDCAKQNIADLRLVSTTECKA